MTGPEHFAEAERIVLGERCDYGCPHGGCAHEMAYLARAQVHALLALTAATALPGQHPGDWEREIWSFGPETGPGPEPEEYDPGPEAGDEGGMFAPQAACCKCGAPIRRTTSGRWHPTDRFDGLDANPCEHDPGREPSCSP